MNQPHPQVRTQPDGSVQLGGYCAGHRASVPCQLTARRLRSGRVLLTFHGVEEHSITITATQQAALRELLGSRSRKKDTDTPES